METEKRPFTFRTFRRVLRLLRSHPALALLGLLFATEVFLRAFTVPYRITWVPEYPAYDQIALAMLLGRFSPIELTPGSIYSFPEFDSGYTRCNRARCRPAPPADAAQVLCLGGSIVWGAGVSDDETFPAQLERLLNAAESGADPVGPVAVFNAGMPGTTTEYAVRKGIHDAARVKPDLAVVGYGGVNDSLTTHFDERRANLFSPWMRLARSFHLYRLFECPVYRYVLYPKADSRVPVAYFEENLDAIAVYYERQDMPVCFLAGVLAKDSPAGADYRFETKRLAEYKEAIKRVAERHGAPVVDEGACFGEDLPLYIQEDAIHWTAKGCARIAACTAPAVRELLIRNKDSLRARKESD